MPAHIPTLGRVVHYVGATTRPRAAIVSYCDGEGVADLHVLHRPTEDSTREVMSFEASVPHYERPQGEGYRARTWHWPAGSSEAASDAAPAEPSTKATEGETAPEATPRETGSEPQAAAPDGTEPSEGSEKSGRKRR